MKRHRLYDDLERCPYCKRFMTAEQAKHHVCNSPLIDVKEVDILYHYMSHNEDGDTLIVARGLDGVLYKLRQCKDIDRRIFTRKRNRRGLDRACLRLCID